MLLPNRTAAISSRFTTRIPLSLIRRLGLCMISPWVVLVVIYALSVTPAVLVLGILLRRRRRRRGVTPRPGDGKPISVGRIRIIIELLLLFQQF